MDRSTPISHFEFDQVLNHVMGRPTLQILDEAKRSTTDKYSDIKFYENSMNGKIIKFL